MSRNNTGFTIVELLVVIVVIGILAAISIVAFNGVIDKAKVVAIESDLKSSSTQLELFKAGTSTSNTYPAAIDCGSSPAANTVCLKLSSGSTQQYTYDSVGGTYCLSITNGSKAYFINSINNTITAGVCSGHTSPVAVSNSFTWTERAAPGSRNWSSVATSSDGTKLVAMVRGGNIFTSTDSGATWTERVVPGSQQWSDVASSSDGVKLVASAENGFIYTSTNSGVNWTARDVAPREWSAVASSANGEILAGVTYSGTYISMNSGVTWNELIPGTGSHNVAISSDGSRIIANNADSGILFYYQGVLTQSSDAVGVALAVSGDGQKVIASYGQSVNTSNNFGQSWTLRSITPVDWFSSIAMTVDGNQIILVDNNDAPSVSSDGGNTWNKQNSAGTRNWSAVAISNTGDKAVAAVYGGYIYTAVRN